MTGRTMLRIDHCRRSLATLSQGEPTSLPENLPCWPSVPDMDNFRTPAARSHKRTAVSIDVTVNGVLNFVDGRITDLSEGGARIDGASMPARSRCEIHFGGEVTYAVV